MVRTLAAASLLILCTACATASAQDTAPPGAPGDAPTVYNVATAPRTTTERGGRVQFMDGPSHAFPHIEIHTTILNPGLMPHAAHRHVSEEIIVVQQGTLAATVNGVTETVGPGSVLVFLSNDWHELKNVGTDQAIYTVSNVTPRAH
jgi:XRE family transcriptional regulator, regulator of sulfur utilization